MEPSNVAVPFLMHKIKSEQQNKNEKEKRAMCEHCNHERKLKVGDRVNVDWHKALKSGFGNVCWIIENIGREDRKQGILVYIDDSSILHCEVKFDRRSLWLMEDWLSLADESKTGE